MSQKKIGVLMIKNLKNLILNLILLMILNELSFAGKPQVILGPGTGVANFRVPYHQNFNRVLSADTTYILTGWYFVDSTYSITIPAGTLIRGDSASGGTLIIKRGAKIYANGTRNRPIVFTSNDPPGRREPGDWGGVIILGKSITNKPTTQQIEGGFGTIPNSDAMYGGNAPHDNSGVFRYVRIEFPGIAYAQDNEVNGLTLGGVGDSTIIEYVQVSFGNDDDFEFFGGTVNAKYLVSWRSLDDTYDTDFGWSGRIQFAYTKRDPLIFDASAPGASNGFESDNEGASPYNAFPRTKGIICNATIVGPQIDTSMAVSPKYQFVALLRRATELSIYNSILMGYPRGIQLRDTLTQRAAIDNRLEIRNTSLQAPAANLLTLSSSPSTGNIPGFNIKNWFDGVAPYQPTGNLGSTARNTNEVGLRPEVFNLNWTNNPVPYVGSEPDIAGTAYQGRLAGDNWFDSVSYRGAFDPKKPRYEQWDWGWTNYEPENYDPEENVKVNIHSGWNLVSIPLNNLEDYSANSVFSNAVSKAYKYIKSYQVTDSLNFGYGFWIKYQNPEIINLGNGYTYEARISLNQGWNLIGSLSVPFPITNITSDPPGLITSQIFGYDGTGYQIADTIKPGKGYWIKANSDATLILSQNPILTDKINILLLNENPPNPPANDYNSSSTPDRYILHNVYPNPFNPSTKIKIDVPEFSNIELSVYNVLGQKVKTLLNSNLNPGSYEFEWDGTSDNKIKSTSGIYYIKMSTEKYQSIQKVLLVK